MGADLSFKTIQVSGVVKMSARGAGLARSAVLSVFLAASAHAAAATATLHVSATVTERCRADVRPDGQATDISRAASACASVRVETLTPAGSPEAASRAPAGAVETQTLGPSSGKILVIRY